MSNKARKRNSTGGLVYSTNPYFHEKSNEADEKENLPADKQKLRVYLDTKNRKGKKVTLISGYYGKEKDLSGLEKDLKNHCGTGGSSKHGEILIQGDQVEKVREYLINKGYGVK